MIPSDPVKRRTGRDTDEPSEPSDSQPGGVEGFSEPGEEMNLRLALGLRLAPAATLNGSHSPEHPSSADAESSGILTASSIDVRDEAYDDVVRRTPPKSDNLIITEKWQLDVELKRKERGIPYAKAREYFGIANDTFWKMLQPEKRGGKSRYVRRISEVLGVDLPIQDQAEQDQKEISDMLKLTPGSGQRDLIKKFILRLPGLDQNAQEAIEALLKKKPD